VSFQEMMMDVGENQKQKEATLPFYFICLLHLANEKVLNFNIKYFINYYIKIYSLYIIGFNN
jgi:hypothetical protein